MNCPHCNTPQPDDARFCSSCGKSMAAEVTLSCPSCNSPNAREARFCKQCGTALAAVAEGGSAPVAVVQSGKSTSKHPKLILVIALVVLFLLIVAIWFFSSRQQSGSQSWFNTPESAVSESVQDEQPPEKKAAPRRRTCDEASGINHMICRTEGADKFWRCAPDGVNWNKNKPGCEKSSGKDKNALY